MTENKSGLAVLKVEKGTDYKGAPEIVWVHGNILLFECVGGFMGVCICQSSFHGIL